MLFEIKGGSSWNQTKPFLRGATVKFKEIDNDGNKPDNNAYLKWDLNQQIHERMK